MPLIDTEIMAGVRGVVLLRVSPRRWRVLDRTGRVLGHLRAEDGTLGVRFHAERFDLAAARMRDLGAFWTARDAVEAGDAERFHRLVARSLDKLAEHDWQADGIETRYRVT